MKTEYCTEPREDMNTHYLSSAKSKCDNAPTCTQFYTYERDYQDYFIKCTNESKIDVSRDGAMYKKSKNSLLYFLEFVYP